MSRRDEYKQHLKSPEWKEQRELALIRTDGFCQYCGEVAVNVHHVKYPKQFGGEHPHSLIPVCERCHNISHGVQKMTKLVNITQMTELAPNGTQLKYLLSGARVYASAKSWARALQVPTPLSAWFEQGLPRTAILKKDSAGGALEASYLDTPVYRWHAVAELLRAFDREWHKHQYGSRPKQEQREIERFQNNYDRLVSWGYDLQERALSTALNPIVDSKAPITQDDLIEVVKQAVAPRLQSHDNKLHEHDVVIAEIKEAVPALRDPDEFISVKQAIMEQGLDPAQTPLLPQSRENLSGLAGQMLKAQSAEQGASVMSRVDGQSIIAEMNTFRRRNIYAVLREITRHKQEGFRI